MSIGRSCLCYFIALISFIIIIITIMTKFRSNKTILYVDILPVDYILFLKQFKKNFFYINVYFLNKATESILSSSPLNSSY
jgi:hypothetical protein